MQEVLYKYRSLDNFKNFIDIILRNRLYASRFKDLNDPMEGQYYYSSGGIENKMRNKLIDATEDIRLCSLSRINNNQLMWSHYANGHRGVAVGVKITDTNCYLRPIQYNGLASLRNQEFNVVNSIEILSHKLEAWHYEEEVRIFVRNRHFIDIEIVEIITGISMSNADFGVVRDLIEKINPKIKIVKAESFIYF